MEPNSKPIRSFLAKLRAERREQGKCDRATFAGMFTRGTVCSSRYDVFLKVPTLAISLWLRRCRRLPCTPPELKEQHYRSSVRSSSFVTRDVPLSLKAESGCHVLYQSTLRTECVLGDRWRQVTRDLAATVEFEVRAYARRSFRCPRIWVSNASPTEHVLLRSLRVSIDSSPILHQPFRSNG